jgi:hypothetical protein
MRAIRSIGIGSAFKVGAVTYALMWVILGGLVLLLQLLIGGITGLGAGGREGAQVFGMVAGFGIIGYIIGIVIYAVLGGIFSALAAFIYNLVAGMVGGIEINLE